MRITIWRMFRGALMSASFVCLLLTSAVSAQSSWSQAVSFGGSVNDFGYAVKPGSDGSQYFAGEFASSVQFGNTQLVSRGGQDGFLAKRDPSGTVLWAVQVGGASDDRAQSLALDGNDNVYLIGMLYDNAMFGSTDGNTRSANGNGYTIFLAKYSRSGALAWVQTGVIGCRGCYNWGNEVAVEPTTGAVYVAALSQTDTTFSSADGRYHVVPGNGAWHMTLAKYDTDGIFYWGETDSAAPNSDGNALAVDTQGSAYVVGWFENQTTFSSRDGHNITVSGFSPGQSDGNYPGDGYIVKYDRNGNAKWVNHFGGYVAHAHEVAVSPAGAVTIVGDIGNINYGSGGEKTTIVSSQPPGINLNLGGGHYTNPYNHDGIIATWDKAGVLKGARRIGGTGEQIGSAVAYDAGGFLWVSGTSTEVGNNQQDLYVLQYSGKTFLQKVSAVNAAQSGSGNGLFVDAAGTVHLIGSYQGIATFGNIIVNSVGGFDIFLAELEAN